MIAMATGCPTARRDLDLQVVGREGLLYDREGELIHILNVSALEIWKLCDGSTDVEAIESSLLARFTGLDGHDVRADIEGILTQFDERGLLTGGGAGQMDAPQKRTDTGPQRRS